MQYEYQNEIILRAFNSLKKTVMFLYIFDFAKKNIILFFEI